MIRVIMITVISILMIIIMKGILTFRIITEIIPSIVVLKSIIKKKTIEKNGSHICKSVLNCLSLLHYYYLLLYQIIIIIIIGSTCRTPFSKTPKVLWIPLHIRFSPSFLLPSFCWFRFLIFNDMSIIFRINMTLIWLKWCIHRSYCKRNSMYI